MTILARAALLGAVTGSRSSLGIAALAVSTPRPGRFGRGASWANNRWTTRLAVLACAGELIGDKLPQTPSRLERNAFASRLAAGAVTGAIMAHREGNSRGRTVLAAALATAGAAAGTKVGAQWRQQATAKFNQDLPGALIEDAVAIAGAKLAVG